jgi:hypothetical protein
MSMYITTERQAQALADSQDLLTRAAKVGITRKQFHACATLKDARALVEAAERAALPAPAAEPDGDPCSMADFPTFGSDPDEADREAEGGRARMGY